MEQCYRVHADINLDAIRHNILNIRRSINSNLKILAVIKADAYGHGAVNVAEALTDLVDYYGIATVEEGKELRKHGIEKPLLILGYTLKDRYEDLVKYDITQTIFDYESAILLDLVAARLNKKAKIHIKLDTGMSRIGYQCDDASCDEIEKISKLKNIDMEGIFSHYAKADEEDKTAASLQLLHFKEMLNKLSKRGIEFPVKHLSNSAGIMEMNNEGFDMVRSGIVTYGLYPSEEVDKSLLKLEPAMSIKSVVVHVKEIAKGTAVGYGGTFIAPRKMTIATIPVGYADGYFRSLSGKSRVLIHGEYAPVIGRICMDQLMVDVSDIQGVNIEDEVVIVGKQMEKTITVEEVANMAGSFNYEFVCGISRRVPRIYIRDNKIVYKSDYLDYE